MFPVNGRTNKLIYETYYHKNVNHLASIIIVRTRDSLASTSSTDTSRSSVSRLPATPAPGDDLEDELTTVNKYSNTSNKQTNRRLRSLLAAAEEEWCLMAVIFTQVKNKRNKRMR